MRFKDLERLHCRRKRRKVEKSVELSSLCLSARALKIRLFSTPFYLTSDHHRPVSLLNPLSHVQFRFTFPFSPLPLPLLPPPVLRPHPLARPRPQSASILPPPTTAVLTSFSTEQSGPRDARPLRPSRGDDLADLLDLEAETCVEGEGFPDEN